MGRGLIIGLIFIVIVLFASVWSCNKRNSFVELREDAKAQWQQLESQYQRRADIIPNFVATVKAEANFEKSTLEGIVTARAKATQVTINPDNLDEASIQKYKSAQGELSSALSRLLVVTENYPDLKSNAAFKDLRVELEGSENRISNERLEYNKAAARFNKAIQFFPGSLIAGSMAQMPYFEAETGTDKAPKVEF